MEGIIPARMARYTAHLYNPSRVVERTEMTVFESVIAIPFIAATNSYLFTTRCDFLVRFRHPYPRRQATVDTTGPVDLVGHNTERPTP